MSMCPNQRGSAKATVKIKWLEAVNTKGINPHALFSTIIIKRLITRSVLPGDVNLPIMALNSKFTLKIINENNLFNWEVKAQKDERKKTNTTFVEIQLKLKL